MALFKKSVDAEEDKAVKEFQENFRKEKEEKNQLEMKKQQEEEEEVEEFVDDEDEVLPEKEEVKQNYGDFYGEVLGLINNSLEKESYENIIRDLESAKLEVFKLSLGKPSEDSTPDVV